MPPPRFPTAILERAALVTGKRSRAVVDQILRVGHVTTEDLKQMGYDHPPRAIRDVREQGLPIATSRTKNAAGRMIASYTFGDPADVRQDRAGGRQTLSKSFRDQVATSGGGRCAVCHAAYEGRYLQTDHRIPFEVAGETAGQEPADYMPLCGSCNRAKSWSCEHCPNGVDVKDPAVCATCYWARPDDYRHVAMKDVRRLDVVWEGTEVRAYDQLVSAADAASEPMPEFVKRVLRAINPADGTEPDR